MNATLHLLLLTCLSLIAAAQNAERTEKETAKIEERMRDEKKRDEQQAKDYATRVKVARFDTIWRTPRVSDIDVVQGFETPTKPLKPIALLTFECAAHEEAQAVAGFVQKGRDLGADGVKLISFDDPNSNQAVNNIFSPNDRRVFRANAFTYSTGAGVALK
jgi:hypothetical protein